MKKSIIKTTSVGIFCSLAFIPVLSAEDSSPSKKMHKKGHAHKGMMHMDTDGDGMISKVEMLTHFDSVDQNGDGLISNDEIKEQMKKRKHTMKKNMEGKREKGLEQRFEKMDANQSGSIEKDEFKGPDAAFEKIDQDQNGALSKDELKNAHAKMKKGPKGDRKGGKLDKFDSNQDGVITREEFKGPEEIFNKIDTNQDGQIDGDEKAKAKEHMKKRGGHKKGERQKHNGPEEINE